MQIGRYEVVEEIARGGMGVVFKASDPVSRRFVAIKVLLDPDPDPRFLQEVRALARLQHPGIVTLYDTGKHVGPGGLPRDFVVMELVEGESLQDRLRRDGPFPVEEALALAQQLAEAVAYAHERGVLHRDLKPHNVLIAHDGRLKLADFGLGKVVDWSVELSKPESLTRTGEIMGTPAYMPPEQAAGEKERMGPASDVYSLGATLYALLTGRPPFEAETPLNLICAVLERSPDPPSKRRPEVPPEVDAIVMRCLAKEPAERYADARELIAALSGQRAGGGAPPSARGRASSLVAAAVALLACCAVALARVVAPGTGAATQAAPDAVRGELEAEGHEGVEAEPDDVPRAEPRSATDFARRGSARYASGDLHGAIADFSEAIRCDPQLVEAFNNRAVAYLDVGDAQRAIADCSEAIRLRPDFARAHHNRGRIRHLQGDPAGAIADCTEAIRLQPDHAESYNIRGLARMAAGDNDGAIADFSMLIFYRPGYAVAYKGRATARYRAGDYRGALDDCDAAIRLQPDFADAYVSRGSARVASAKQKKLQGTDHEQALRRTIEDFEQALALRPDAEWAPRISEQLRAAQRALSQGE